MRFSAAWQLRELIFFSQVWATSANRESLFPILGLIVRHQHLKERENREIAQNFTYNNTLSASPKIQTELYFLIGSDSSADQGTSLANVAR